MNIIGVLIIGLLMQQPRLGSLEGTVLQAGTAQPVPRAVVELIGTNKEPPIVMATAADGKFEFRNLPPGRYRLNVSRNGYLDGKPANITIEAGEAVKDIRLSIVATGAISGRVYDGNGEPLANVPVQAFKYSYSAGQPSLTGITTDTTNDRGEYRLFWLPPGQYFIGANPRGVSGSVFLVTHNEGDQRSVRIDAGGTIQGNSRSTAEKLGEADAPVYYPGVADPAAATPVALRSAADITGVDFTLTRVRTRGVRGIVIDGATGQPARNAAVVLVPRTASIAGPARALPSYDGTFNLQNVLPGSYYAFATLRSNNPDTGFVTTSGGRVPVEVGATDVNGLTIVLSVVRQLAGEVLVEGLRDRGNDYHHPVVIMKSQIPVPAFRDMFASFRNEEQFTIDNLIEGDYQVELTDMPVGAYVKSMRFGGIDVLNDSLRFDSRSTDRLQIVLSMNAGSIAGTVADKSRKPVANARVAIVPPAAYRQRADLYRSATTDDTGRFQLQGIPPGDYSLFAWEDIEDGLWRDPDFIQRNEAAGKPVHLGESSHENVDLTAIPFAF
jgi:hypothetical protein